MAKSDESLSDFSNFTLEAEEDTDEKTEGSTKTSEDNNYCENHQDIPKHSNKLAAAGIDATNPKSQRKKSEVETGAESSFEEQNYEKLRVRIQGLMRKEKKLQDKKESNPLYWCLIGAEYSDCCGIILRTISGDLSSLSPPKNIDENQDLEAIKRKYRVIKAYDLLSILNDCFKRIYWKINEFYNQHNESRYHYVHLAPSIQGFESNAKLIEDYIERLKQYVNTMFEMKHTE